MPKDRADNSYKAKFRPDTDSKLDAQIDTALSDVSLDALYGFDKPKSPEPTGGDGGRDKGVRRGKSSPLARTMPSSISAARARGSSHSRNL